MNTYDMGDVVRLSATFSNSAGTVVDPSSVTLQYKSHLSDPSSVTTLVYGVDSISKVGVGVYYADVASFNTPGTWDYRWNGLGSNAAAEEGKFAIRTRNVG